ncbi:MAG: 5'-nucleotidase C-terminal domain-containing protein [Pararhodobacter sp.]|nr:5'-nucleotidase C-terminal domain-containing protein [Pararhodobacter sp.]
MFNPARFAAEAASARTVHLRLIETTDLHLHLLPFDYYADRAAPGLGLVAAASLIERARAECANSLLFDNGDFLQGTPLGDFLAHERGMRDGDEHPVIAAMNALGFDAITLGNHEFNYGLDFLMKSLAGAACPVVSANLATSQASRAREDRTLVAPYALLDREVVDAAGQRHPIRIGVIGFAPPQVVDWDRHALEGRLHSRDIVEAAQAWVPEMREAGADLVIALAHSGIGGARHEHGMENAAVPLARVAGVDALMTGHSHLLFPSPVFSGMAGVDWQAGTLAGKPAVMGGFWGSHIGLIDLLLLCDGGEWRVLGTSVQTRALGDEAPGACATGCAGPGAIPHAAPLAAPPARHPSRAASARPDADAASAQARIDRVAAAVAPLHEDTRQAIRRPVGRSEVPLHSFFVHLGVSHALALVAEAQRRHVAARLRDSGLRALPVLSAVAPFKAGGRSGPTSYTDIPAGPLALRHIADLYSFPNALAALRLSGAEVLEWLERSGAAFNQLRPGSSETVLRDPRVPGYNFEVIDGLSVEYDLSQPARYAPDGSLIDRAARRVVRADFDGQPLDPAAEFILATNSYRAGGAGAFPGASLTRTVVQGGAVMRDVICAHIRRAGGGAPAPLTLRFTPLPGTHVLFETGPGARHYLDEIAHLAPEPRGLSGAGFLRLRLDWSRAG